MVCRLDGVGRCLPQEKTVLPHDWILVHDCAPGVAPRPETDHGACYGARGGRRHSSMCAVRIVLVDDLIARRSTARQRA